MSRRRRSKSESPADSGGGGWLVTYSDLVTLILTFFVLLQAFSSIEEQRFRELISSVQGAFVGGGQLLPGERSLLDRPGGGDPAQPPPGEPAPFDDTKLGHNLEMTKEYLDGLLGDLGSSELIEVRLEERGLVVRVLEPLLFERGRAQLKPDAIPILSQLGEAIEQMENPVIVEGHTCDLPINTAQFPSNWELSVGRAVSVTRLLIESHDIAPQRIAPTGYAEYRPIVPNISEKNRSQNRRVDIIILGLQGR